MRPATRRLALLLALVPAWAGAESTVRAWTNADGTLYVEDWGAAEPTLSTGTAPQTYHVGAAGRAVTGPETVTLHADCSATSALVGDGGWMRWEDGFRLFFVEGAFLDFAHQEPPAGAAACGPEG